MNKKEVKALLEKFEADSCTVEEIGMLESWYLQWRTEEHPDFIKADADQRVQNIWNRLEQTAVQVKQNKETFDYNLQPIKNLHPVKLWYKYLGAAVVILTVSIGIYFFTTQQNADPGSLPGLSARNDIKPGITSATLTLADGRKIILSDAMKGQLAEQAGVSINKTANGQLVYTIHDKTKGDNANVKELLYNSISTARGEQYQVVLPDGSKVFLNAVSSIRFPASFANLKNRTIELSGEAYFEVSKSTQMEVVRGKLIPTRMPFIVKTKMQEVEVLGTHFNINSYPDEENTKTTLLEGAVKVSSLLSSLSLRGGTTRQSPNNELATPRSAPFGDVMLKPGQQSVNENGIIKVSDADTEEAISWTKGRFIFNDESLESIMRKVSRWYDIDVEYHGVSTKNLTFGGLVSRTKNISAVLEIMESTGKVKFKIEGKKIIVMN